jgi:hypothetical protein
MKTTERIALKCLAMHGFMSQHRLRLAILVRLPWWRRLLFSPASFDRLMARLSNAGLAHHNDRLMVVGAMLGAKKTTVRERTYWLSAEGEAALDSIPI